jgi:UDP-GlcNAc:undecaprenyl-phosphate/decaprenyl-phosphate GlcNAc-1-phosphate transferase
MRLRWMLVLGAWLLTVQLSAGEPLALKTENNKHDYRIKGAKLLAVKDGLREPGKSRAELTPYDLQVLDEEVRLRAANRRHENELRQKWAKAAEDNKNRKEWEAFQAKNKKKEGVVTLPSGVQYKMLQAGGGKKATEGDTVEIHYRGTLIDGTEFENSFLTGQPAVLRVGKDIAGWSEALKLMPLGSRWQLFVPPEFAYRDRGWRGNIAPGGTLIFEVELVAIR